MGPGFPNQVPTLSFAPPEIVHLRKTRIASGGSGNYSGQLMQTKAATISVERSSGVHWNDVLGRDWLMVVALQGLGFRDNCQESMSRNLRVIAGSGRVCASNKNSHSEGGGKPSASLNIEAYIK